LRCEKCGRFTLFKKLCDTCAREQQAIQALQAGAGLSPSPMAPPPAGNTKVQLRTQVHGNLKLHLQGQDISFDLSKGLTDEMLGEIAGKLNMPREKVRQFLEPALSPTRIAALNKTAFEVKTTVTSSAVVCPACGQQVPAGSFCSHCGAALPG